MDITTQRKLVIDFEHDDSNSQQNLFTHLNNLLRDIGEEMLTIEVVTYGPAIYMLTSDSSKHSHDIKKLQELGVLFRGCRNAMKKHHIVDAGLLDNVMTVPSGIGHIVKTQLKGAIYIKA